MYVKLPKNQRLVFALVFVSLIFAQQAIAATLKISPANKTVAVGETFTVDINLDTQGAAIDGLDVYSLRFNPSVLEVVDANSGISGVQVSAGNTLPLTLVNAVNNSTGTIQLSQTVTGGTSFVGSGKIATITFRVKGSGSSDLSFDFRSGATNDTNVASAGKDILTSVGNSKIIVSSSSASGTSTPPPSMSPPPPDNNFQEGKITDLLTPPDRTDSGSNAWKWVGGVVILMIILWIISKFLRR